MSPDGTPHVLYTAALLKVASRCNLSCDYCYVYQHADQSWRRQPPLMAAETWELLGRRLADYVQLRRLQQFSLILHGGEPLLYGAENLAGHVIELQNGFPRACHLDVSVQTNGVLLTPAALRQLQRARIRVSISLDGSQAANDLHRLDHHGQSSFHATERALRLLMTEGADLFNGVLAVVDPRVSARQLFEFFSNYQIPRLDFLLPDATYQNLPLGREQDPDLFARWLIDAFETWYTDFPAVPVRWFDALLGAAAGIPSPTDIMGLGSVNLLVIETDGGYHDHDVMKITQDGQSDLGMHLRDHPIALVEAHPKVLEHARLLTYDGLCAECKACPAVGMCGGGSVPHRFAPGRGFDNPSVYCRELYNLIRLATHTLRSALNRQQEPPPDIILPNAEDLPQLAPVWRAESSERARTLLASAGLSESPDLIHASPARIILPLQLGAPLTVTDPAQTSGDCGLWLDTIRLHAEDPRLRLPFADTIRFPDRHSPHVQAGLSLLPAVAALISGWSPAHFNCLRGLVTDLLFAESTMDDETGIFSFSDDNAPHVLFVAAMVGQEPLCAEDFADSIVHEYLHLVLHHMQTHRRLLYDQEFPVLPSPWRAGLRTAGGFLHGTFVFSHLVSFWRHVEEAGRAAVRRKARANVARFERRARYACAALADVGLLTPAGETLLRQLTVISGVSAGRAQPANWVAEPVSFADS